VRDGSAVKVWITRLFNEFSKMLHPLSIKANRQIAINFFIIHP
jgi:hypothetical protein